MAHHTIGKDTLFFVLLNMAITGQSMFGMEHIKASLAVCTKSMKLSNALKKTSRFLQQEALLVLATVSPVVHAFPMDSVTKNINGTFYDHQNINEPLSLDGQIAIVATGGVILGSFFFVGFFCYGYHMCQYFVHQAVPDSFSEETEDDTDNEDTLGLAIVGGQDD